MSPMATEADAGTACCSRLAEVGREGVLGSHSPSTWYRDRYLRASSSRMTGREIWSTTPHWRPLSGVTWKMSCGGGWLKEGCLVSRRPPAHPPGRRDSPQGPTPDPCVPAFSAGSALPASPPGPIPLVPLGSGRGSAPGKSAVCPPAPPLGDPHPFCSPSLGAPDVGTYLEDGGLSWAEHRPHEVNLSDLPVPVLRASRGKGTQEGPATSPGL